MPYWHPKSAAINHSFFKPFDAVGAPKPLDFSACLVVKLHCKIT
jgi:hypothetical protein